MPRLPTDDLRIRAARPLDPPAALARELPLDEAGAEFVARSRRTTEDIILGRDDRLLVVVGPCSIHDPVAALDFARRLHSEVGRHAAQLFVIMRVYFEKPRTTVGWKGLINDPGLDDSFQINHGLRLARRLMLDITRLGLPVATEFLDTTLGQFYADLVTWAAIGARTVESQVHRELASGLSMPVGFKNRTDGDVQVAVDAIRSAREPHWFPSLTKEGTPAILGTAGNLCGHLVLRGGTSGPNYMAEPVDAAAKLLSAAGLPPLLMVDCSHANSGKDANRQPAVAADLARQIGAGSRALMGLMIESNLAGGAQDYRDRPLVYGRSVTDPCLPFEQTVPVLAQLAEAVRARRAR
ncbi:MAG: 3-deoxy-7-phosphoheptulonate synthase [Verrucomicrobia bacterium RIFCSPLOWO2_12_FULL_64_8]|nr:MAG: 3-deoxy-7-phosphoheptulonate synthase [Verrucomicrobia bacterium RIFCSPLOWO2_12_FULL_64_8]